MTMVLNFFQDIATPHNNYLLKALNERDGLELNIWYAYDKLEMYNWEKDLTNEIKKARIFGFNQINWEVIKYVLTHKDEKFFIVGWNNHTMRILIPLMWILRRPYNMWFDMPQDTRDRSRLQTAFREIFYLMLKYSNARVFCVGSMTVAYFKKRGFQESRLVNLPIFIDLSKTQKDYAHKKSEIFSNYKIKDGDLFITAGSRIIHEKGYDLLISAIALLDENTRKHVKVIIVGSGPCVPDLEKLIVDLRLENQIILEKWLAIEDFKALIANSNVFIHPARWDSYGGTTLGMALGIPVIGSCQAGAALDRISQGRNGFLYDAEDIQALANFITQLYHNPDLCKRMGQEASKTALEWPPHKGSQVLIENAI